MDYRYLKSVAEQIKLEINKTDVKCIDIQIIYFSAKQFQIILTLTKDKRIFKDLEVISYDDINNKLPKIIKEKVLKYMVEVIK